MTIFRHFQQAIDRSSMARFRSLVSRVERLAPTLKEITNAELRKRSLALRYDLLSGKPLESLLIEGSALVQEAAYRSIGLRHYPVQLLGGIAMHFGSIAVMQTGEGKTLTATLPVYLAAISGKGAHLATANDYLAARDADLMRPVYELLGLSIGVVQNETSRSDRQKAYAADITYSTAKEIGFDFLRDRLIDRNSRDAQTDFFQRLVGDYRDAGSEKAVQRSPHFILVDEADSILIDEARTPLIISSAPDEIALTRIALYRWSAEVVGQFKQETEFTVDPPTKRVSLNENGRMAVRKIAKPTPLHQVPVLDLYEQIEQAIFVELNYVRDRHYVVRAGEVVIVDEFTGRLAEGRKWRSGLHQAIEARENVEISVETGEAARITIQDLFLRYPRLCGMTGTVASSAAELRKIYRVKVLEIPTNRPPQRKPWPDLVFATDKEKWTAIADETEKLHRTGRPVLVGTRSIDKSERLSQMLKDRGVKHEVLNARQLDREASIVSRAGEVSRVTVATNMAGRGTDIKISSAAVDLGGLHVICSELHESARIDRQLIGRCGRQGDPGTYRQFLSLEDDILESGFGTNKKGIGNVFGGRSDGLARLAAVFRKAQAKIEKRHFDSRKLLLYQEKIRHEMLREMGQDPFLDASGSSS